MRMPALRRLALSAALLASTLPGTAVAQTGPDVTFELRPHCEQTTEDPANPCPEFPVRDPLSRQTDILKVDDTLDMDLVMHNPSSRPLKRFRVWIGYDSNVLEGTDLDISDVFPVATPGEEDFSIADNYIKLSGTADTAVTDTKIVLARITVKVKNAPTIGTMLSFHDANGTGTAHTAAFISEGDIDENVASTVQGSLAIRFDAASSASSASTVVSSAAQASSAPEASSVPSVASSVPASSQPSVPASSTQSSVPAPSSSSVPPVPAVFSKLQVQSLRVTTEGSSVFLAWNPLPSAELAGYNLYYGSISGRYLQRRSVDQASQTLTIRALPVGQTYYFAVRAVNAAGEESDFSQEVAVTVGNPATSTSPLSGALIEGGPQGNAPGTGGTIAGDSGPGTWVALIVAASAVMGTLLAFRRQWTASVSIR